VVELRVQFPANEGRQNHAWYSTDSSTEDPGVKLLIRVTHFYLEAGAECVEIFLRFLPRLLEELIIYSDKFVITPGFIKVVRGGPLILLCGAGNFGNIWFACRQHKIQ
jgi:hypothetical protein